MSQQILFYTHPQSRGSTVHWMLEEISCPYSIQVLDFATTLKAPDYLAINPMGKIPAIQHGDQVVTEAAAICAYLADAFPEAGLAPAPAQRGDYYRWLFFATSCAEPAMVNRGAGLDPTTPEMQRRFGYGCYTQTFEVLAGWLKGRTYIAGNRFSAADLYMSSLLAFGMMAGLIDKRPEFEAYSGVHTSRPAALRAREQAASLLARKA
jgi:glutathione S-transferase